MKATILVIETDPIYQAILKETLTAGGYDVVTADSSVEGLDRARQTNPKLIILDVMMESAISGFEVARRLKSKDPASAFAAIAKVPILILTAAHQSKSSRFRPDEEYLPIEAFMEKPAAPDALLKRVREILDLHP